MKHEELPGETPPTDKRLSGKRLAVAATGAGALAAAVLIATHEGVREGVVNYFGKVVDAANEEFTEWFSSVMSPEDIPTYTDLQYDGSVLQANYIPGISQSETAQFIDVTESFGAQTASIK